MSAGVVCKVEGEDTRVDTGLRAGVAGEKGIVVI